MRYENLRKKSRRLLILRAVRAWLAEIKRARAYRRAGLCPMCGAPAGASGYCDEHYYDNLTAP